MGTLIQTIDDGKAISAKYPKNYYVMWKNKETDPNYSKAFFFVIEDLGSHNPVTNPYFALKLRDIVYNPECVGLLLKGEYISRDDFLAQVRALEDKREVVDKIKKKILKKLKKKEIED